MTSEEEIWKVEKVGAQLDLLWAKYRAQQARIAELEASITCICLLAEEGMKAMTATAVRSNFRLIYDETIDALNVAAPPSGAGEE